MPTFPPLILFTTTHCHLCEEAIGILNNVASIQYTMVEISDNQSLINLYGTRIPVLQKSDTQAEIDWPFNENDITNFIDNRPV